jgi:hypothetical protein
MNCAQRLYLARFGATTFQDLLDPLARLEYANLMDVADPVPVEEVSPYTSAAVEWLGDRHPDDLSLEAQEHFQYLNTDALFLKTKDQGEGVPRLPAEVDPAKLAELAPERRLQIKRAEETVLVARAERRKGVDPRLQKITDRELALAELLTKQFWRAA